MSRKPPKTSVPQRANNGSPTKWVKGGPSPNAAGRFKLPDWFKSLSDQALAMQAAAGLGIVVELDDDTPESLLARQEMARDCPANIRDAASNRIVERLHGSIKQEVKADETGTSVTRVMRLIIESPHGEPTVSGADEVGVKRPLSS